MKGKSVFVNYFLSYLVILFMSVLVSMGIYVYSYQIINDQSTRMNQVLLNTLRTEVDGRLSEIHKLMGKLMLDSNVQKALSIKKEFSIKDREMLYEIYNSFLGTSASSNFFNDVFIYFNNTDTTVSLNGHMTGELFYNIRYRQDKLSYEEFDSFMQGSWYWSIEEIENKNGENEILFLQSVRPFSGGSSLATLCISLKENTLNNWMADMKWDQSMDLFIINKENLLIGEGKLKELASHDIIFEEVIQEKEIRIGGNIYLVSVVPSEVTEWYYVAVTPAESLKESARKIQLFAFAGLFISITGGIAVSYFLTKMNYYPLKSILELFKKRDKSESDKPQNEYQYLLEHINHFFEEHKEAQKRVSVSEKVVKKQYLYRLVTIPYDKKVEYSDEREMQESFLYPWNLVVLVTVSPHKETTNETVQVMELEKGLSKFVVANIFEELVSEKYKIEHTDLGDTLAFIINAEDNGHEVREHIEAIIDHTQRWLSDKFMLKAVVFAGAFQGGLEGVHSSYLMAREAYEYRGFLENQVTIWYDDIKNNLTVYEYTMEMEQKIINAIKAGEADMALQWIMEVIRDNYENKTMNSNMKNCLLFDLLGTVLKGANQSGIMDMVTDKLEQRFSSHPNVEQIAAGFQEILNQICENIRQKEQVKRNDKQFSNKVMEYVAGHYQDPDLNISQTAMNFNITPAYLSAVFKEQTELSLLEYINSVRVEQVKTLLNESYSIAEIASMTGFRNSGALIRVFKRVTGITPGQMKKLQEEN